MNLFEAIFQHESGSTAILFEDRQISYAELRTNTLRMAEAIGALGTAPGDRIALLLHDSPEFVEAFIAICSTGRIAVPINPALRLEDHRAIINNCRPRATIAESEFSKALLTGPPAGTYLSPEMIVVDRVPSTNGAAAVGQHYSTSERTLRDLQVRVRLLQELLTQCSEDSEIKLNNNTSDTSFILYTSGSTGEPKGAMHSQTDIFCTSDTFCREVLQLNQTDKLFSSSRLPFAYGLGNSFSFPLLNGATSVLCREKPTPEIMSRIFSEVRPTIFFAVPVVYSLLLEHHHSNPLNCSSLRMCVSAGEALPGHIGEQWEKTFGVPVLDGIGSTEMLHMFMSNHLDDVCYGSSGKVLKGYEAQLLDEHGNITPVGSEGNLWIKGDSAASGYWDRPGETARTFVNGWVRTGDLYRRDGEGHWFHMGRSDDCFKSSGQWVSPVEVEGVLLKHDHVARVAVVEGFDDQELPCACAFVVMDQKNLDSSGLEMELRQLAATALPRFKQPRHYRFVSDLPYTATGKIQRFKLRHWERGRPRPQ